ncbi:MAG TPA: metalloregulator ArsR/SmtB family transcription factor [Candidatus Dormibacteraeota bacterium]|jgi:ArsR family transcriptional regulator
MKTALPERVRGVCCAVPIPLERARASRSVEILKALADPTRLQMVGILKGSEAPVCICDFTATFKLSQPTISHHIARLREAGLVDVVKEGLWAYYRLSGRLEPKTRALLDVLF